MNRLRKRDVEALLATYDTDPIRALTAALRHVLSLPEATFDQLVGAAPLHDERRALLLTRDVGALDELVAELNEQRTL